MTTDLERFRDHARRMASGQPTDVTISSGKTARQAGVTDPKERELWTRLADEADAYLNRQSDEALFS